jgi:hypothetical protein
MKVKGTRYEAAVAQVVEKDPDGRPRALRLVYPEEKVSTANEPEFLVGFFPAHCLRPSRKRHN